MVDRSGVIPSYMLSISKRLVFRCYVIDISRLLTLTAVLALGIGVEANKVQFRIMASISRSVACLNETQTIHIVVCVPAWVDDQSTMFTLPQLEFTPSLDERCSQWVRLHLVNRDEKPESAATRRKSWNVFSADDGSEDGLATASVL